MSMCIGHLIIGLTTKMRKILFTILVSLLLLPSICSAYTGVYKLEGNSNDYSGNGYNGTDSNLIYSSIYGKKSQGIYSSTTSSYITVSDATNARIKNGDFTFSGWVNNYATDASWHYLFSQYYGATLYFRIYRNTNYYTVASKRTVTRTLNTPANSVVAGKWQYITVTRSGAVQTFYINGLYSAQITNGDTGDFTSGCAVNINLSKNGAGNILGYTDEIILDNTSWNAQKVKTMYSYYQGIF